MWSLAVRVSAATAAVWAFMTLSFAVSCTRAEWERELVPLHGKVALAGCGLLFTQFISRHFFAFWPAGTVASPYPAEISVEVPPRWKSASCTHLLETQLPGS